MRKILSIVYDDAGGNPQPRSVGQYVDRIEENVPASDVDLPRYWSIFNSDGTITRVFKPTEVEYSKDE